MSIYCYVTEQDMIILAKIAEKQNNQSAIKPKNKFQNKHMIKK